MGLDAVEMMMLWEDSLGVTIAESEAAELETPRQVTTYLAGLLSARPGRGGCLTQRAFHRLRHALSLAANVPRGSIRPSARVRELVPADDRRRTWVLVRETLGMPALPGPGSLLGIWSTPRTVGELARWVVTHAARALKSAPEPWTRAEVREVVRGGVTEITGQRDFADDAHFVRDLRID